MIIRNSLLIGTTLVAMSLADALAKGTPDSHLVQVTEALLAADSMAKGGPPPEFRLQVANVAVIEFGGSYSRELEPNVSNVSARADVAREFFAAQVDNYDFLVAFTTFPVDLGDQVVGLNWSVSNSVQGIGRPLYANGAEFGSASLLSYIDMADALSIPIGSGSTQEDQVLDTLMHELMHQWSAHLHVALGTEAYSPILLGRDGSHWSALLNSDASVMYGSRWQEIAPNSYRAVGIGEGYGPLDLYAAGFLEPAEVGTITVLTESTLDPTSTPQLGLETNGVAIELSIDDVLAAEQTRFPAAADSQKAFRAGIVLLVRPDDPSPTLILDRIEQFRHKAQDRFAALTLGRGGLVLGTSSVVNEPAEPSPVNGQLDCGAGAPVPCDTGLEAAVAWLLASQAEDGSWSDKPQTVLRDTAAAAAALVKADANGAAIELAVGYLEQAESAGIDQLAGLLEVGLLSDEREDHWLAKLLALQSSDGGFAQAAAMESTVMDTALALKSLSAVTRRRPNLETTAAVHAAVLFLQSHVRIEAFGQGQTDVLHCWPRQQLGACDLTASVLSVEALAAALGTTQAVLGYAPGLLRFALVSANEWRARLLSATADAGLAGDPRLQLTNDFLLDAQLVGGSWDHSVPATARAIEWLIARDRADLAPQGPIIVAPGVTFAGQLLRIDATVTNAGLASAPSTLASLSYRQSGAVSATPWLPLLTDQPLPPLDSGQAASLGLNWDTAGVDPGDWDLRLLIDTAGQVAERDELNNERIQTLLLLPAPELADLQFGIGATVTPQVVNSVPTQVEVALDIENLGRTDADQFTVRANGIRFGELIPLDQAELSVSAQSRAPLSMTVIISDPDISGLALELDALQAIVEHNENNNRIDLALDRQPAVDLAIAPTDLVLTPAAPDLGLPSQLQVTVHNRGTQLSPLFRLRVQVVADGSVAQELFNQELQLPAAQSLIRLVPWTPASVGAHHFEVDLDPTDVVMELDETNNHAELALTVGASLVPNLRAQPGSLSISPDPAEAGSSATVSVVVENVSTVDAGAFDVGFYFTDPSAPGTQVFASVAVPELLAGQSQTVQTATPVLQGQGSRLLFARVDSSNTVVEANEADNDAVNSFEIIALADLVVSAAGLRSLPTSPAAGEAAKLEVLVVNAGQQQASGFEVSAEFVTGGAIAAAQIVPALNGGEQQTLTFSYVRPPGGEGVTINVSVDTQQTVIESDEANNSAALRLQDQDPNLFLSESHISPNGDGIQDTTELVAHFEQAEDVRVRILTSWGEEAFRAEGAALLQTQDLSLTWDGRRSDGRRALDDRYSIRVERTNGELLGSLTLVVDTNRSPLVEALTTGHQQQTPLACAFVDGVTGNPSLRDDRIIDLPGLDAFAYFGRLPNETEDSLFVVPLSGEPPTRLVRVSELFAGAWIFREAWLIPDGSAIGVIAESTSEARAFQIDLSTSSVSSLPWNLSTWRFSLTHRASLDDGWEVFVGNNGLVAFNRGTGEERIIGGNFGPGLARAVGRRSIVAAARDQDDSSLPYALVQFSIDHPPRRLLDLAPNSNEESSDPNYNPLAIFLHATDQYVVASGYRHFGSPSFPIELEQILLVDESSGNISIVVSDSSPLEHRFYTLAVEPSGDHWFYFQGAPAKLVRVDSLSGERAEVPLEVYFDAEAETSATDGLARALVSQDWSPDGSRLYFRAVSESFFPTRAKNRAKDLERLATSDLLLDPQTLELLELPAMAADREDFALQWLRGELQLVSDREGVLIERGLQVHPLFAETASRRLWKDQPGSQHLVFSQSQSGPRQGCEIEGTQALTSAANGTARLRLEYVDVSKTFLIFGTARDLNFESYTLSYRDVDGGGAYQPLLNGATAIDDLYLGSWSPPSEGRYRIRLSVRDLAGNQSHYSLPIVWFEQATVGLVSGDHAYISPNSDGVQDALTVSYELRAPLSFTVNVSNAIGTMSRTEQLTQTSAGTYQWIWDGRDQSGALMPDGDYRVRLYDRSVDVVVDTIYPQLSAESFNERHCEAPYAGAASLLPRHPFDNPISLEYGGSEVHWREFALQRRTRAPDAIWSDAYGQVAPSQDDVIFRRYVVASDWSGFDFRVVGSDLAGNRSVYTLNPSGIVVSGFRWLSQDWGNNQGPLQRSRKPDLARYFGLPPVAPASIELVVEFADPNAGNSAWVADFYIGPPIVTGADTLSQPPYFVAGGWRKVEGVAIDTIDSSTDQASGGSAALRCLPGNGRLGVIALPPMADNEGFFVQIRGTLSQSGPLDSDFLQLPLRYGQGGDNPPPLSGSFCPNGDDIPLSYCERVGVDVARVPSVKLCPWLQEDYFYRDPITAELVPLSPAPGFPADHVWIDISTLPLGDVVLQRQRLDLRDGSLSSASNNVGHDSEDLPVLSWESPPGGAKVCLRNGQFIDLYGEIDDDFLTDLRYRLGINGAPWGEWSSRNRVIIERNQLPQVGPALSNVSPLRLTQYPDDPGKSAFASITGVTLDDGDSVAIELEARSCIGPVSETRTVTVDQRAQFNSLRVVIPGRGEGPPFAGFNPGPEGGVRLGMSSLAGDVAQLSLIAAEPLSVHARLYQIQGGPVFTAFGPLGWWSTMGEPLREWSIPRTAAGPIELTWDGLDGAGQSLADGDYGIELALSDDCGHVAIPRLVPIYIDNTAPQVSITAPLASATVALYEPIETLVVETHLRLVSYAYRPLVGNGEWVVFDRLDSAFVSRPVVWHSDLIAGDYELRVRATDGFGLVDEDIIQVTVPPRSLLMRSVSANPELISPNGDGTFESSQINLQFNLPARLSLTIEDSLGAAFRLLVSDELVGSAYQTIWDGRDDGGQVVPDGIYQLHVLAVDPNDASNVQEQRIPLTVDATPPLLSLLAPVNGFATAESSLIVDISDATLQRWEARSNSALPHLISAGESGGPQVIVAFAEADEGEHQIQLSAFDLAGNQTEQRFTVILDTHLPQAFITSPSDGDLLTRGANGVTILGTASDAYLSEFQLHVSPLAGGEAILLATGSTSVSVSALGQWSAATDDGEYVLRLSVSDLAGNERIHERQLELDNTAPTALIESPSNDALVGASFAVVGTATDLNLLQHRLSIAPRTSGSPQWQALSAGSNNVESDLIATAAAPLTDGPYVLRLQVEDAVGLVSEAYVDLQVDTQPPLAATVLIAESVGQRDVRLQWNASGSADIAGYRIQRDGAFVAEQVGVSTTYIDADVSEGTHRYQVISLDRAGNESAPSNQAQVRIDTTPPEAQIEAPALGSRVRGEIAISGRAYSREDFERYTLTAVHPSLPGGAQIIVDSGSPIAGGLLATFDSTAIADGALSLSLQAWDYSQNQAEVSVQVTIDNTPPAPPTGVVATVDDNDVTVTWQPNSEPDLAGYLVYRGPVLLNGSPLADPLSLITTDLQWLEADMGDGQHEYRVVAIDTTGNASLPSAVAAADISGHPPTMTITRPTANHVFDGSVLLRATTLDQDIVEVHLEFRPAGGSWAAIAAPLTAAPFEASFEPMPRAYGIYELRARAIDSEALEDPAPPVVSVEYRDLVAPDAPSALSVSVDAGDVSLSWQAVVADDVDRYRVYRRSVDDSAGQIVAEPASDTLTHSENGISDDDYRYWVTALDAFDNESDPSPVAAALVHTPILLQPYAPGLQANMELLAESLADGAAELTRTVGGSASSLPEQGIGASGGNVLVVALLTGVNTIELRVRDQQGNRSKPAQVVVGYEERPSAPTGLSANLVDFDVNLSWAANPESSIWGYRVFRGGASVLPDQRQSPTTVTADPDTFDEEFLPELADGNLNTTAYLYINGEGVTLQLDVGSDQLLLGAEIAGAVNWDEEIEVEVFGYWQGAWIALPSTSSIVAGERRYTLAQPYPSHQLRLLLRHPGFVSPTLGEVRVQSRPLINATQTVQTVVDGLHRFRVSAVNNFGYESDWSDALEVPVGDAEPPLPVQLAGALNDADVSLSWTASASADVAGYRLYRRGQEIFSSPDLSALSHVDAGLANGSYDYQVFAYDAAGNAAGSNVLILVVEELAPGVPQALTAQAAAGSGAIDLSWQAGDGADPARYRLKRSLTMGGPFAEIASVLASQTNLQDTGLTNGTRYYYVVAAEDARGNLSADSAVASAVPFSDQRLATPVFLYPTQNGRSVTLPLPETTVSGYAEPDSTVLLGVNGSLQEPVQVPASASLTTLGYGAPLMSVAAGGAVAYLHDSFSPRLLQLSGEDGEETQLGRSCGLAQWIDPSTIVLCTDTDSETSLRRRALSGAEQTLLSQTALRGFRYSGDGQKLAVIAQFDWPDGTRESVAWRDGAGSWQELSLDANAVDGNALRFDPSGRWLLLRDRNSNAVSLFDTQTNQLAALDLQLAERTEPAFHSASERVLLAATGPQGAAIYQLNLASAAVTWLDFGLGPFLAVGFDPTGERVSVLGDDRGLETFTWPALSEIAQVAIDGPYRLFPLATGESIVSTYGGWDELYRIAPVGLFRADQVALDYGENVLAAVAQRIGQPDSLPALPINVVVPADGLPDLEVSDSDLSLLPNGVRPGDQPRLTARVRNRGSGPAAATEVRLTLATPDGALDVPAAILASLLPGQEGVVSWILPALSTTGLHLVQLQIDPNQQLVEAATGNNAASLRFTVSADGLPQLALDLASLQVAPTENLLGALSIVPGGTVIAGQLRLRIVDANGSAVATLFQELVTVPAVANVPDRAFSWMPGAVAAGEYRVEAELSDQSGTLVASSVAPFTVGAVSEFALSVQPALATVSPGSPVGASLRVGYLSGNRSVANAELRLRLETVDGDVLADSIGALPEMSPGFDASYSLSLNPQIALDPGQYLLRAELWQQSLFAEAAATQVVAVAGQTPRISGSLQVPTQPLPIGLPISIPLQVLNDGDLALTNVPIRASIRRSLQSAPLAEIAQTIDLALDESWDAQLDLPANALGLGSYLVSLSVAEGPFAGVLDFQSFLVVDALAPTLSLTRPAAADIVPSSFRWDLRARDLHSSLVRVRARLHSGGEWRTMTAGIDYAGQFLIGYGPFADGDVSFEFDALDAAGNLAQLGLITLTVDGAAPQITITGADNGGLYNAPRTLSVQVVDAHLANTVMLLDGEPWTGPATVMSEGDHGLYVAATDAAGNNAEVGLSFTIDLTPPPLIFTQPDAGAVISTAQVSVAIASEPAAQVQLQYVGGTAQALADPAGTAVFDAVPLVEGDNLLVALATDAAGNESPSVQHLLIRSQSTLNALSGSLIIDAGSIEPPQAISGSYAVTNVAAFDLSAIPLRVELRSLASGQLIEQVALSIDLATGAQTTDSFSFASDGLSMGDYRVVLSAQLGNAQGQPEWVELSSAGASLVDLSAPLVVLLEPLPGALSGAEISVVASVTDALSSVDQVSLEIDGLASGAMSVDGGNPGNYLAVVSELSDGPHQLRVTAVDQPGNAITVPPVGLQFVVDSTPPVIIVSGVDDDALINSAVLIDVQISDPNLQTQTILLDGQPFMVPGTVATEGAHQLRIEAADSLGNSATRDLSFTLDLTPPIVSILEPADQLQIIAAHVPVVISTEVAINVQVSNGASTQTQTSDSSGLLSIAAVPLQLGDNLISAVATDRAGNESMPATVSVRRVRPSQVLIQGQLNLPTTVIDYGQPVVGGAQVGNGGVLDPGLVRVSIEVLSDSTLLDEIHSIVPILPGEFFDLPFSFDSTGWPLGPVRIHLSWSAIDDPDAPPRTVDQRSAIIGDGEAPALTVLRPANGSIVNESVAVRAEATDGLSEIESVAVRINGGPWQPLQPDSVPDQYIGDLAVPQLDYSLIDVRAVDTWQNQTLSESIVVCRATGGRDKLESGTADQIHADGFEGEECAPPPALKQAIDWLRYRPPSLRSSSTQSTGAIAPAAMESRHD